MPDFQKPPAPPVELPPAYARIEKGKPFRWYRLISTVLNTQLFASPSLADVTAFKWQLSPEIETHIVSEWLTL